MKPARFLYFFNDRAHFQRFLTGMTFVALLAGIGLMFIPEAWAAAFTCTGGSGSSNLFDLDTIGNVIGDQSGGSYTINPDTATSGGDPFGGACPSNLGIFGTILCFFKVTVGQIVSSMYCTIQQNLIGPFSIAIELFIVLFGVTVMTGMIRFTPREAIIALLKVAFVWVFAMNATWGIGVGYTFFMGVAEQGSSLILNAVGTASGSAVSGGGGYLTQPDNALTNIFSLVSTGSGSTGSFFPSTLTATCAIWLIAFMLLLLMFMPMVGGFLITLLLQYVMLYVRALLGYLTSLVLISFLFILSPIFISFALFQITRPMFERWFSSLLSFSLQMIIIFAFLVLLQLIPIGAFLSEMLGLLREYDTVNTTFTYPLPTTFCSICDYTLGSGNITDTPPPITCADNNAIPLGKLFLDTDLVQAILSQIVALWIVGIVMQDFLKQAPAFASTLTGGMSMLSMGDGSSQGVKFAGLDSGWGADGNSAIDSSENMESLRDKIESYRSQISPRALPAVLTGAFLLGNVVSQSKKAKTAAKGSTSSGSGSSTASARSSMVAPTTVLRNLAGGATMTTSGPSAGSTIRPMLGSSRDLLATVLAGSSQDSVLAATEYLKKTNEENAGAVTKATQEVEMYKSATAYVNDEKQKAAYENAKALISKRDKGLARSDSAEVKRALQVVEEYQAATGIAGNLAAYNKAMQVLTSANALWRAAITNLNARNEALLDKMKSSSEVTSNTAMGGSTPSLNLADYTSKDQVRDQITLSVNNLQMQIRVQQAMLSPGDQQNAQKYDNVQAALDKVSQAATDPSVMNTSQGLTQVIEQLKEVEKMLIP